MRFDMKESYVYFYMRLMTSNSSSESLSKREEVTDAEEEGDATRSGIRCAEIRFDLHVGAERDLPSSAGLRGVSGSSRTNLDFVDGGNVF